MSVLGPISLGQSLISVDPMSMHHIPPGPKYPELSYPLCIIVRSRLQDLSFSCRK